MSKMRLDQLVLERGFAVSRAQAQALIMAGKIMRGTERLTKAGMNIDSATDIFLEGKEHPWVSRGGMKLAHGLQVFDVHPKGKVCVDVGASTGGFTDVLLHHDAARVYAVDVGHGQLDVKLRNDPRVVVLEKTNARYLTREHIPDPIDLIVCDASFISLKTVLPACLELVKDSGFRVQDSGNEKCKGEEAKSGGFASPERGAIVGPGGPHGAQLIALIKPQFEAGKKFAPKGVVRDVRVRQEVCEEIRRWLEADMQWKVHAVEESPVVGPKGNVEFLIYAEKSA